MLNCIIPDEQLIDSQVSTSHFFEVINLLISECKPSNDIIHVFVRTFTFMIFRQLITFSQWVYTVPAPNQSWAGQLHIGQNTNEWIICSQTEREVDSLQKKLFLWPN